MSVHRLCCVVFCSVLCIRLTKDLRACAIRIIQRLSADRAFNCALISLAWMLTTSFSEYPSSATHRFVMHCVLLYVCLSTCGVRTSSTTGSHSRSYGGATGEVEIGHDGLECISTGTDFFEYMRRCSSLVDVVDNFTHF